MLPTEFPRNNKLKRLRERSRLSLHEVATPVGAQSGAEMLAVSLSVLIVLFAGCKQAEQKPINHSLPIKVAIIYNFGGAQAVAREDFYLLNKDVTQVWKEAGLLNVEKLRLPSMTKTPSEESVFRFSFALDRLRVTEGKPSQFEAAVKPFIVKTVNTDFEGNATFENVPQGDYYIYGVTETRSGYAVWNYRVSTQDNKTVLLDNKNAIYAW